MQQAVDDRLCKPTLVGRIEVVEERIRRLGLRIRLGDHFDLINPESDARFREYWTAYLAIMQRHGVSPEEARTHVRTRNTVIAALTLKLGYADAMLCGTIGRFPDHLHHVLNIIGRADGVQRCAAMNGIILANGTFFVCDTHVMLDPSAEEIAQATRLCAEQVRRFGLPPKIALLSYSNFGTSPHASPRKMRQARELLVQQADRVVEIVVQFFHQLV